MNSLPLVSILMGVYNREAFLGESIRSVLNQSMRDFELIVVDDGSTDASWKTLQFFQDPRIKLIRWKKNRGIAAARNEGLGRACGKWITFFDSDDLMPQDSLGVRLWALKRSPHYCVALGRVGRVIAEPGDCRLGEILAWKENLYRFLRRFGELPRGFIRRMSGFFKPADQLFSASLLRKIGFFDERLRIADDLDYAIRVNERVPSLFVDQPIVHYRVHEDNISLGNSIEGREEAVRVRKRWTL